MVVVEQADHACQRGVTSSIMQRRFAVVTVLLVHLNACKQKSKKTTTKYYCSIRLTGLREQDLNSN